jgi:acyl-CoA synthetase (AMP-forming)/AMP-acid ligase II
MPRMNRPSSAQIAGKLQTAATLARAGIIRPQRPDRLAGAASALLRWGATPAAGYKAAASRYPDYLALVDEAGVLSFSEVHERSNAIANALAREGLRGGDRIGIMCRNHRGWVESYVAANKLGAHALFLNTAFSGPQLAEVAEREDPQALILDEEFAGVLEAAGKGRRRYIAWHDAGRARTDPTLDELRAGGDASDLSPPPEQGKALILTSGTTGAPKGARRRQPQSLDPVAALLERIPMTSRGRTMIAAPLFHAWGFTHFTLAMALATTVVLRRRFDPEETLALTAQHACTSLVVVPVMIQRILELDESVLRRYDLSRLRAVPVSGSALPPAVSERWMDVFGDNLYNLYGSTETAWATIATPEDLRAAPGTAGRPPRGTVVRLYDDDGLEVEPGATGRIFVGNDLAFEGYTGGGGKDAIDGLLSSGDVGHFDPDGRLFIDGRDDDMIVSGGENVFPAEVEDLLAGHEAIAEAAVFGVEDEDFGQRLKAVVVVRPGRDVAADDVKAYVKSNLAAYKVPRDVEFVDELPRTSTGKVLKRDLQDGPRSQD